MKAVVEILPLLMKPDCPQSRRQLVEVSYHIALSYISINFRKVRKILISEEITSSELALEAIASMFELDENQRFIGIIKALEKWNPPVSNENQAKFFISKLVEKKIEQHISRLLRQSDPFFSRILDKLNYFIKKNNLKKVNYLGNVYITSADCDLLQGKIIKEEDFFKLPLSLFTYGENMFENIFSYLKNETSFTRAIPLNLLIFRLKASESSLFEVAESTSDYIEQQNVDSIVDKALNETLKKLNNSYLSKGKIKQSDANLFANILRDIAEDMKNGGVNPGLFKYFLKHDENITPDIYSSNYKNIIEYLFKIFKQNISEELKS